MDNQPQDTSNIPVEFTFPNVTRANPDDEQFIRVVKGMKKGDTLVLGDEGTLVLEFDLNETTKNYEDRVNFPFHQRIFEPGVILHKVGANTRIFIPKERLDEVE